MPIMTRSKTAAQSAFPVIMSVTTGDITITVTSTKDSPRISKSTEIFFCPPDDRTAFYCQPRDGFPYCCQPRDQFPSLRPAGYRFPCLFPTGYNLQEQIHCTSADQAPHIAIILTYVNVPGGTRSVSGCYMHSITPGMELMFDPVFKGIGAVEVDVHTFRFTTADGDTLTVAPGGVCEVVMAPPASGGAA